MPPPTPAGHRNLDLLSPLSRTALLELASLLRFHPEPSSCALNHNGTTTTTAAAAAAAAAAVLPRAWLARQRRAVDGMELKELRGGGSGGVDGVRKAARKAKEGVFVLLASSRKEKEDEDGEEGEWFPPLCAAHERLDGRLVGNCMRLVRVEVSFRCDVVRAFVAAWERGRTRRGRKAWGREMRREVGARERGKGSCADDGRARAWRDGCECWCGGRRGGKGLDEGDGGSEREAENDRSRGLEEGEAGSFVREGAGGADNTSDGPDAERMKEFVERLTGTVTLYLSPANFEQYFGKGTRPEFQFDRVESGCPACVLAIIGGNRELLVALRANMLARAKRRQPRLLRLVEAWMEMFAVEQEMKRQSEALAAEVRMVREMMHWRKVESRRRAGAERGKKREEGRSRHGGGLPVGTRSVDGIQVSQVKLEQGRHHQHDAGRRSGSYHLGGMDGAGDFDDACPRETQEWWPSSISLPQPSPSAPSHHAAHANLNVSDSDKDHNFSYGLIPSRNFWSDSHHPTPPSNSSTLTSESIYGKPGCNHHEKPSSVFPSLPRPNEYVRLQAETARAFQLSLHLDQQHRQQANATLHGQPRCGSWPSVQSKASTGTKWEDFYRSDGKSHA
ncbi:hypothetical protein VTI74DRAFT_2896 [Chaetomium olivicolor]